MSHVRHRCRCGHDRDTHSHHRMGSDCSRCQCPQFRWRWTTRRRQYLPNDQAIADLLRYRAEKRLADDQDMTRWRAACARYDTDPAEQERIRRIINETGQ